MSLEGFILLLSKNLIKRILNGGKMKEFSATCTGNRVIINCASLDDVKRLRKIIVKELQKSPMGVSILANTQNILDTDVDLSGVLEFIKNFLLGLDASDEFEDAVFKCLQKCTYKTTYQINKELFDTIAPEAREDYYEIVVSCVEENLRPFVKSLVSVLKTRLSQTALVQGLFQPSTMKTE